VALVPADAWSALELAFVIDLADQRPDHRVERLRLSGRGPDGPLVFWIIVSYRFYRGRLNVVLCGDGLAETGWLQTDV
jgi:hypothetical protein